MIITWKEVIERASKGNLPPDRRVEKSDRAWKEILTPEAYRVTRQHGTEAAFSSEMCGLLEPGQYSCVCCDTLLFDATEKFDSGTGWPSFTQPVRPNVIAYHRDDSFAMTRIETTCSTCDAHLGHVFPDGPPPGGLRFCMNAVALARQHSAAGSATPANE